MALFGPFSQIKNMKKLNKILLDVVLFLWAAALFLSLVASLLVGLDWLVRYFIGI
jgi:hypothetical protein